MATSTKLTGATAVAVLPVEDYARAKAFYEDRVGMVVADVPDQPGTGMLQAGSGTRVLLYERARTVAEHTALSFEVGDVAAVVADLRGRGIEFEEYDMPGVTWDNGVARMGDIAAAWFTDPEGNIISISQV
jgi:catechol 2,3-dioxygenase-like lactoylglutathione lyase family enzyme